MLSSLPWQFPFTYWHAPLTTLKAYMFLIKSLKFGCSLALPHCSWCTKNFFKGSQESLLLRNPFTPGTVKRTFTNSVNEHTSYGREMWKMSLTKYMCICTKKRKRQQGYIIIAMKAGTGIQYIPSEGSLLIDMGLLLWQYHSWQLKVLKYFRKINTVVRIFIFVKLCIWS